MEPAPPALQDSLRVGYYDPFNLYPVLRSEIEAKLPLTNLHWKSHPAKPLKSILLIPVQFVEEVPKTTSAETGNSKNVATVYIRLMFVKIDNVDVYRSQVRPLIREWLKNLVVNSHVEWMVVLYIPPTSKDKNLTIIKTSSFDKLKIDFGDEGKELPSVFAESATFSLGPRCFKLKPESDSSKQNPFVEFAVVLKDHMVASFDESYHRFSDSLAGYKDLTIDKFRTRLALADLLYDMRLFQDSLDVYKELDDDLNALYAIDSSIFDVHLRKLPKSLDKFKFDDWVDELQLSFHSNTKINLFGAKCLLFKNQSVLFQSLASHASTVSISAIYISNLYQKLNYFLNDLCNTFEGSSLDEFAYCIVDDFLNLPVAVRLIENKSSSTDDPTNAYQLHEILEFKGELKMFQRSKIVRIALSKGYRLDGPELVLQDISLDDCTEVKPATLTNLSYKPVLEALKSEEIFHNWFEAITEQIIQDMVFCGRSKTIDLLSIDLVLLNYQKGNYQESLNVLQDSYEFFILNGWNFMGGFLLEVYLDCIEKLNGSDHEHITMTNLRLLSTLIDNCKSRSQIGINNYRMIKTTESISKLYSNILASSLKLDTLLDYPLDNLFKVSIIPFFHADQSTTLDKYFLEFEFTNLFQIDFNFKTIEFQLVNNDLDELFFVGEDVQILKQVNQTFRLVTNTFKLGYFKPLRLTVKVNENLEFLKEYDCVDDPALDENTTVVHQAANSAQVMDSASILPSTIKSKQDYIYFYQDLSKLYLELSPSRTIQLGTNELTLAIHNGENDIENISVQLTAVTEGLHLELENSTFQFDRADTNEIKEISFPYRYHSDNKLLELEVTLQYISNGEKYSFWQRIEVDTTLTISVSVQDLFKNSFIYSKFQVGTSNPKLPIRVMDNKLSTANSHYSISHPCCGTPSLVAFGEQPASFFYKIIPDSGYSMVSTDTLELKIEYSNLIDECYHFLKLQILPELKELGLERYWFIFQNLVGKKVKFDLNNYGIKQFIKILNGVELGLLLKLLFLRHVEKKEEQDKLVQLMDSVLADKVYIQPEPFPIPRILHISVPVPILRYLQILEFHYDRQPQYIVGEPIPMRLKVETIQKWHESDSLPDNMNGDVSVLAESSPERVNGHVEVDGGVKEKFLMFIQNDDNWLVSGFKKYNFDSVKGHRESNAFEVDLVLIPLNVGKLILPKVIIKVAGSENEDDSSMDIEFKNGLESVLVVPQLESITFSF